jgi:hypothetical protein
MRSRGDELPFAVLSGVVAVGQTLAAAGREAVKRGISALLGAPPAESVRVAPDAGHRTRDQANRPITQWASNGSCRSMMIPAEQRDHAGEQRPTPLRKSAARKR